MSKTIRFAKLHPALVRKIGWFLQNNTDAQLIYYCSSIVVLYSSSSSIRVLYIVRERAAVRARTRVYAKRDRMGSDMEVDRERRVDAARRMGYYTNLFATGPSKSLARKALKVATEFGVWDGLSLVGLYLKLYEASYSTFTGSQLELIRLHSETKLLYTRLGDEAANAIRAVMSDKMKWVTSKMGLLLSPDGYSRHVVPVMALLKSRKSGEQSEWRAKDHSGKPSVVKVEL